MTLFGFFSKDHQQALEKGLEKTRSNLFAKLGKAIIGKSKVDDEVLDELEEILISSDVGIDTTLKIIQRIETRVARDKFLNTSELNLILREEIMQLLGDNEKTVENDFNLPPGIKPYIILVVGVNGSGKTTTIGKLASQYSKRGKKVILGAADTFRAAAIDQLKLWGERAGVPVVGQGMGADPASVAFKAVESGTQSGVDVVIIDTAGRLHTKVNLMNELAKIKKVLKKFDEQAPHEVLLVLDGSTGQNAFIQAREFTRVTEVTALAITKLDGTAKGGVVIGIADEFRIPVKYIGVGEKVNDLQIFNKEVFVDSLFKNT
ncbi:MAG TPA: signal recognition particle-docking protein FtsY [Cyclobacteriaceae bacterium]|nr:signal recognition particle-docking protein FtsY [Cyclobacteriaceae bacterium]